MTTIKITPAFNDQLNTIREAGKTPWVIINEDYAVGAYAGRTQAREAKAAENLEGKILKADEVEFEVVDLAAAAQALHDEATTAPVTFEETPSAIQTAADNALKDKQAKPAAKKVEVTHESTIERPCKRVWVIADDMLAANPNVKRKEVLEACVKQGIAYYTARTQYQQWLGIRKEMAEREAQQAKK